MFVFYVVFQHNLVITNILTLPVLFITYMAYYLHSDFTPPVRRVIGITGLTGFILLFILLLISKMDTFLSSVQLVYAGSFVLLAIYYFIHKVFYTTQFEISKHALFYISTGLLFYHFTSIGITSSYSFMPEISRQILWSVKLAAYIIYNVIIGYGFYIFSRYRLAL